MPSPIDISLIAAFTGWFLFAMQYLQYISQQRVLRSLYSQLKRQAEEIGLLRARMDALSAKIAAFNSLH